MKDFPLLKRTPLSGIYEREGASCTQEAGWLIAEYFNNPAKERNALDTGAVLADWSHIGKITLRGTGAADAAGEINPRARSLPILQATGSGKIALLRLTVDEFLVLCLPGKEKETLGKVANRDVSVLNHNGGLGCLVLGGAKRDLVLERSSAMNLRRDLVGPGAVVQTTVHSIHCTLYRTTNLEVLLHERDYSQSLFEALMDVGEGVGLIPTGIEVIPVGFHTGE